MALRMTPALLDRIKFRGVGGQPFEFEPARTMFLEPASRRSMSIESIPDDYGLATQLGMQLAKKGDDLLGPDAVGFQLKVKRDLSLRWGKSQSTNRRNPSMMLGRNQLRRRLPTRSPGAVAERLQ